jgi:hypothetical protein
VNGSTYKNQWLGIQVDLPNGFKFSDLNCFYPNSTIFSATDGHVTLKLEQLPSGASSLKGKAIQHLLIGGLRMATQASGRGATAEIQDGQSLWTLHAEGRHAKGALLKALHGWKQL